MKLLPVTIKALIKDIPERIARHYGLRK